MAADICSDRPDFVEPDRVYICIICKNVLQNPYQLGCGHHMCQEHLQHMFVNNNSFTCPEQACGSVSELDQVFPDGGRKREIACLLVRCSYRIIGCEEIMEWRNLQEHCERCRLTTVECPNMCGEKAISRGEVCDHMKECPLNPRDCSYFEQGCSYKGTAQEIKEHEDKNVSYHLSLLSSFYRGREASDRAKNCELKAELRSLKEMFLAMREDNQELHEKLSKAKEDMREMKKVMVGYGEKNIHVMRKLDDVITKDVTKKLSDDVICLKESLTTCVGKITFLERAGPIPGIIAGPALTHMERQMSKFDTEMNKLHLEIKLLETADHTGTLMWKIQNYGHHKEEALSSRNLSLYSQPFYTGRYGYRMCARVYLNGDGNGKGTHLSFFFVVMKGDYDALLEWPFRQHVTLILLDQSGMGQDIRETFIPSTTGNSFQRPETEMNVGCGVPRFCSLGKLESDTYLRNDTIFLMVKVDCADVRML